MSAILVKEIKSYFKSPFGWIFLAVFTFFEGAFFVSSNIYYGSPYLRDSLGQLIIVLIFLLPLLTMRIIAEEKRQKTDQFLITAPISLVSVIMGKFFSLCVIMLMSTAICAVGAGIMAIYGTIPIWETIAVLGGFFMLGCELIAIGMFLSSVTEHQFLAAIFTYAVYFFTMIVPNFVSYLFGLDKPVSKAFKAIDIFAPFDGLMSGVIDLNDILYMLSVIAIFIILTYKVFAKNSVQLSASGKNRFFISNLLPFVIIAVIIGANVGCKYIPTKYTEFDVTKNQIYKITDDTKAVLDSLNEDVTIYVLSSKEDVDEIVKHYVDAYDSRSSHVKVQYKPSNQFPGFASKYTDSSLYYSSLIIEMGEQYRVIDYYDMFEMTYDYTTGSQNLSGIDVEGQVTAAISSMINGDNSIKVYCLNGHKELPTPQYITDTLKKAGYRFEELYLYADDIPEDCDMLLINGPQSDLSTVEIETLKDYVNNGGKLFLTTSIEEANCKNYDDFIRWIGVDITEGTLMEANYQYLLKADDPTMILNVPDYDSPFSIGSGKMNFFYLARGLKYDESNVPADLSISNIYVSSNDAYAKKITETASNAKEDSDEEGPFYLGLNIKKKNKDTEAVADITIISCGAFLLEDVDSLVSYGNSDLFIDVCKQINDNSLITTIPVKHNTYEFITVNTGVAFFYMAMYCVVAPLGFIIAGIVIFILRRRK